MILFVLSLVVKGQTVVTFSDATSTHATCWDASGLTLSGNTTTNDVSYQWYVSNVSSGSGFSKYSGSGATNSSIGITSNSVTRYYKRARRFTNSGGTLDSAVSIVTVHALPTISGTLSVCKGATRTLTGRGEAGTWLSGDNSVLTISSTGVVTGVSDGTTTVTYTDANSCSISINFTVNDLPTVSAGTDQSICTGSSVSLSATYASGTSISWNNSVSNNVAFSPTSTATYTVVGVDGNGCIATDEVQVTVLPLPTISGSSTVCVNATITLTGSGSPSTSTPWVSSSTNVASISSNGVVTGLQAGTTTITYTDSDGCQQTHDVTVQGLPAVNAGTDFSVCEGTQISLSGGGANSYSWDNGVTNGALFTASTTTTYTVTGTNSNNCTNTDQVTVTVNPVPTISGSTSVCEGQNVSLSVDITSGTWDSDDDGILTVNNSGVVTGVGNGTTNVTYTVNGCTDTYAVTVYAKPSISGTLTATAGGSSVTLSASGTAFGTNGWSSSSTSVATINASGVVSPVAVGTTDITFTNSNGCTETATFTVTAGPAITSTVSEVCVNGSITLTATPSGGTWTTTNGTGSGSISSTGVFTGSSSGSVVVTYSKGGASATTTVTVNALPVAPSATSSIEYCKDATATALTATASGGHTLVWYGTDGTTVLSGAPTPSTGSVGSTNYYVAQQNTTTGCEGAKTTITVTVNALPVAPTATTTVDYCQDATATALTATASSGHTLVWYGTDGTTVLSGAPVPPTATAGSTNYYVAQENTLTGCEGPKTTITVTVSGTPSAPTVSDVSYCKDDVATALTATASSGNTLVWYDANQSELTSGAPTPLTSSVGTTTYYVAQQTASGCEGSKSTITVTVNALPVAPSATSSIEYCKDATATALTATASGGHTLVWYGTDGTTVLSGAPTPSTGSVGSTNYYVAQQNTTTGCEGAKTTITVTVNALPVAPTATTTVDYCQDATATALTATASSGHTLVWYGTDGTTVLSGAPVPPTATAGSTNYYVAQENTLTGCEGPKTTITVTVSGTPSAPTVSDVSYCKDDVATALTATASSGNTLVWYDANQSELTSGAPTPLTSSVGTTTYYVAQQTASGCEGSKSTITVTVNALPVAPSATSSIEYCKDATATALTATASGGSHVGVVRYRRHDGLERSTYAIYG